MVYGIRFTIYGMGGKAYVFCTPYTVHRKPYTSIHWHPMKLYNQLILKKNYREI